MTAEEQARPVLWGDKAKLDYIEQLEQQLFDAKEALLVYAQTTNPTLAVNTLKRLEKKL